MWRCTRSVNDPAHNGSALTWRRALAGRAAAAAGQSGLMALYEALFGMMDLQAAQVRWLLCLYN